MSKSYFVRKDTLPASLVKELSRANNIERLYRASFQRESGFYLIGVATEITSSFLYHNEIKDFTIPVKDFPFEFEGKPNYMSILWLNRTLETSEIQKTFENWNKYGTGLHYWKIYESQKTKSKIIRMALSEEGAYQPLNNFGKYNQALVVEFEGTPKSAKILVDIIRDKIKLATEVEVKDSHKFAILGDNLKNNSKIV